MNQTIESLNARVRKIRNTPSMTPTHTALALHDIADALECLNGRLAALEEGAATKAKHRADWAVGAKVPA